MKKFFVKSVLLVAATGLLSGLVACTKEERIIERQAPPDITQSFSTSGNTLTIQKASLGKRFLLLSSGTTTGPTPQWMDVKPQVVTFELDQAGKKLALNEVNYNVVYNEIEGVNLLTTFNILAQDANSITFDWGKGLTSLTMEDVFDIDVTDPSEAKKEDEGSKEVIPVIDSYVKSLSFDGDNNLEINQVSKVRTNAIDSDGKKIDFKTREETLSLNLQIRPYRPGITAKLADPKRRVGFFVTKLSVAANSATQLNVINRWDLDAAKGPITFYVPSSVPSDYVQAVTEGALYWNKVFGREVVAVVTGADPHMTPKNRSIIIHWVPWLDAGAAYAQAQADPLTGEILRGQIFMPSAFTRVGSAEQLALNGGNPVRQASPTMNSVIACDFSKTLRSVNLLAREASNSERLRLAQDSVRATVAHEAGHALGLRHNFAGSFSAKVSTAEVYEAAKTYLKNPNHPGLEATTSIMDYVSGLDDVLSSAYIKHDGLSYDKMAMAWAYGSSSSMLDEKVSLYCSDEDIGMADAKKVEIYGCQRFDAGNNPLYRHVLDTKDEKDNFIPTLFISIIGRLYPADSTDRTDLATVLEGTKQWGQAKTEPLDFVSQLLLESSTDGKVTKHFISFENAKSHVGVDYATSDPFLDAKITADMKETGGYAKIFNLLLRDSNGAVETAWYENQIAALQKAAYFQQGETLGGRAYVLSADDQAQIVKFFESFTEKNQSVILAGAVKLIPEVDGKDKAVVLKSLLQDGEALTLASLVKDLDLAKVGAETAHVGAGLATEVELPTKFISGEDMALFTNLLKPELLNISENAAGKLLVEQSVRGQLNQVILAADPSLLPADKQATATKEEYKAILDTLNANKSVDTTASEYLSEELKVFSAL